MTSDYTEAIRGIDECLELIEHMFREGEVQVSLAEVSNENRKKVSRHLKKIKANTEKFGHQFSSFISALSELSESQNFKDRSVFKEMTDFLNALRGNIQEAL